MSTPEDVAARPDWAEEKAVGIVRCWLDSSGTLAAAITTALREAEQRGTASQRATIERLERALTEIRAMDEKHRPMLQQCSVANLMGETARAALSPASAKTAEDRG